LPWRFLPGANGTTFVNGTAFALYGIARVGAVPRVRPFKADMGVYPDRADTEVCPYCLVDALPAALLRLPFCPNFFVALKPA
jgi:hypothetical protein